MVIKMKYLSLWLKDYYDSKISVLDKNLDVDVLIIGGGITGLTTLYELASTKLKVALVDADLIGHGLSSKTTGKINYLQELIYQDLEKKYSIEVAKLYYESQKSAINKILTIIKKEKIKCNLEQTTSYVFTSNEEEINKLKYEKEILTSFGSNVLDYEGNIANVDSVYAIGVSDTYVFNPLKYLYSLKNICSHKFPIYENTKIIDIKKDNNNYICYTKNHFIKAKKIVLACHYPFFLFPYFMPIKTHIEKSYITASKANYQKITAITSKNPCQSIRYYQDDDSYQIYLTNSCNLCNHLDEGKNFKDTIKDAKDKNLKVQYVWKNDDLITVDKLPYIGRIEKNNDNLLMGTGYNTWGMTNGTLAGLILSDIILNKPNKYENMCNPLRVNSITNLKEFICNLLFNMKGYIQSKIFKNKDWYSNVRIENINGKSIGIYKEGNKTYKVYNKCPHMGCSLIFNEVEKTWDCPCHASRFNLKGKCIKGPSKYNITYKD